jgi:hypothetical protein
MLVNCWVLFVNWRTRVRLFLAGLTIPALVGIGSALFTLGTGKSQHLGSLVLAPFLMIGGGVTWYPRAALALWVLTMIALVLAARTVSSRNREDR